tara:strand:+ start:36283 stop:37128 length:846 start_codon:yes stop_codon:yes gene_type:complete
MKKVNYLNNKDLLSEIHKSKSSFCSYSDPDYATYDLIVPNIEKINIRTIAQAKRNKARRLGALEYERRKKINPKVRYSDCEIGYQKILKKDLVFRVMTYDHVPDEIGRRRNPRSVADRKTKVNFPPFQHWKFNKNENLVCIGKSHWEGGLHNGKFNKGIGQVTNRLAMMWMKLCERYATRGNVRGYTYNDEMQGQAILQLAQIGLQFDESKSNNPFAYYTAAVTNSFVRIINIEKRNQNIRDDIMEMNNMMPSSTRQAQATNTVPGVPPQPTPTKKPVKKK